VTSWNGLHHRRLRRRASACSRTRATARPPSGRPTFLLGRFAGPRTAGCCGPIATARPKLPGLPRRLRLPRPRPASRLHAAHRRPAPAWRRPRAFDRPHDRRLRPTPRRGASSSLPTTTRGLLGAPPRTRTTNALPSRATAFANPQPSSRLAAATGRAAATSTWQARRSTPSSAQPLAQSARLAPPSCLVALEE